MKTEKSSKRSIWVGFAVAAASFFLLSTGVFAAATVSRENAPYDSSLSDQSNDQYAPIDTVGIARLSPPAGIQYGDEEEWLKGLYYYSIAKQGFADIPYNYVVGWQGGSYEGKAGGNDVLPIVAWDQSDEVGNVALIVYFDNNREMTNAGMQGLADTLSSVLAKYNLNASSVAALDVSVAAKSDEVSPSSLVLRSSKDSDWHQVVGDVKGRVKSVGREPQVWKGTIEELVSPENANAGENFVVTVHVKNDGNFPWYNSGDRAVYLATSDPRGRESEVFVNDKWASFSRVGSFEEEWVLPGESATFDFEIGTPYIPGTYTEKFELLALPDRWIAGTQFGVKFNVSKGNFEIVEIQDTETGYLNVRDCPSVNCNELGQVSSGETLIKTGKEGSWYKVKWRGEEEGWVYGKYVKEL